MKYIDFPPTFKLKKKKVSPSQLLLKEHQLVVK